MSDQPEALRLANAVKSTAEYQLVLSGNYEFPEWALKAAAELRRLHQVEVERDALKADAERYRWLRDWDWATHDIVPMTGRYGTEAILGRDLDAAIDAARSNT